VFAICKGQFVRTLSTGIDGHALHRFQNEPIIGKCFCCCRTKLPKYKINTRAFTDLIYENVLCSILGATTVLTHTHTHALTLLTLAISISPLYTHTHLDNALRRKYVGIVIDQTRFDFF